MPSSSGGAMPVALAAGQQAWRLWVGVAWLGHLAFMDSGWSPVYTDSFGAADPLSSIVSLALSLPRASARPISRRWKK